MKKQVAEAVFNQCCDIVSDTINLKNRWCNTTIDLKNNNSEERDTKIAAAAKVFLKTSEKYIDSYIECLYKGLESLNAKSGKYKNKLNKVLCREYDSKDNSIVNGISRGLLIDAFAEYLIEICEIEFDSAEYKEGGRLEFILKHRDKIHFGSEYMDLSKKKVKTAYAEYRKEYDTKSRKQYYRALCYQHCFPGISIFKTLEKDIKFTEVFIRSFGKLFKLRDASKKSAK